MKEISVLIRKIIKAPILLLMAVASRAQHFKMYEKWWVPQKFEHLFGLYERETTRFFKKHVKRGMTVVDVGANVGYYTRLFSRLVGPEGVVYAFEPDREAFEFLRYNTERLPNVKIFPYAVSDRDGEAHFYHIPKATQSHTLVETPDAEVTTVKTVTLDAHIPERIDVIKIDIEGAETLVFAGMKRHLMGPCMAVFEYTIGTTEPLAEELRKTGEILSISANGDAQGFSEGEFYEYGRGGNPYINAVYINRQ